MVDEATLTTAIFDRQGGVSNNNGAYSLWVTELDNGDKFYGNGKWKALGYLVDGVTSNADPTEPVQEWISPSQLTKETIASVDYEVYDFYYETVSTKKVNKFMVWSKRDRTIVEGISQIGMVKQDGTFVSATNISLATMPYFFDNADYKYSGETEGFTVTFDSLEIGPNTPIKVRFLGADNSMYFYELQFSYDGPSDPTFAPLSNLSTSISSAQFENKQLKLSGEVTASDAEGAETVYKTLATTEPGLTPDQVLVKINAAPAGALVTGDTGMAAEVVIEGTTYPVTLDTTTDASDDKTPWVLVMNYVHQKGIDSGDDLKVLSDKLPIQNTTFKEFIDNSSVPTEYNTASWGHTGQALFDKICVALGSVSQSDGLDAGVELMFRMYSNQSASKIHFKTHKASLIENYRGNPNISASTLPSGTFWPTSEYTVFDNAYGVYDSTAHNSPYNPAKTSYFNYRTNDYAMTNYPFYPTASYDSSYRYVACNSGSGESSVTHQWLVDNNYAGDGGSEPSNNRTIHQIWVRANKAPGTSLSDLTIPKVLDITGAVYDISAVNYANVYLYGSDGVNLKHDALDFVEIPAGDSLPHVNITSVSEVTGNQLTVSGTVFSSVANITSVKAAVFDPNFDLADADQAALASFVNTNGTDIGLTSDVYAVGTFTDFAFNTAFNSSDLTADTTEGLVDGSSYQVAVIATDGTNVGIDKTVPPTIYKNILTDYFEIPIDTTLASLMNENSQWSVVFELKLESIESSNTFDILSVNDNLSGNNDPHLFGISPAFTGTQPWVWTPAARQAHAPVSTDVLPPLNEWVRFGLTKGMKIITHNGVQTLSHEPPFATAFSSITAGTSILIGHGPLSATNGHWTGYIRNIALFNTTIDFASLPEDLIAINQTTHPSLVTFFIGTENSTLGHSVTGTIRSSN